MKVRVRIAPSPTGDPHIGTAYASLFNFAFAAKNKGKFILRIEDTDRSRLVRGTEKKIFDALRWLGLNWDEGPDIGGTYGPYKQSERLEKYKKFAKDLVNTKKAYYCDCSLERLKKVRDDQQKKSQLTQYDKKCRNRNLKASPNTVVRLTVPSDGETFFQDEVRGKIGFKNTEIDDQVLLKSDGFPTYHLASVVDDHLMEITHVIRAEEWLSSTPKHVLLYQAFGWQIPKFVHLPLLRNPDKSKISKRKNPVSLIWYKDQGYLPSALLNYLANLGWSMRDDKEIFSLDEFIDNFSFERIDPAGPIFDVQKLDWMNGEYIRKTDNEELENLLSEFTKVKKEDVRRVLPLIKERMKKLSEFDELTDFFFKEQIKPDFSQIVKKYDQQLKEEVSNKVGNELEKVSNWVIDDIEKTVETEQKSIDWSKSDFYMVLRMAVSGSTTTPPLFEMMEVIGKAKVIKRLKTSS